MKTIKLFYSGLISSTLVCSIAILIITMVLIMIPGKASAAPGDAFDPSDSLVFVSQNIPTQLFRAVPDTNGVVSFAAEGPVSNLRYNGIAYNPADNYLYGVVQDGMSSGIPTSAVVRIGQDGVVTRVGTSIVPTAVNAGTFADDGFYYVGNNANTGFHRINVTTGAILQSYTLPTVPGIADFVYAEGYFWSVDPQGGGVRIGLTPSPTVTFYPGWLPVAATNGYGAAWRLGNGNIAISDNAGPIYQIAISNHDTAPTATIISTQSGPASATNDGASGQGLPVDLAITKQASSPTFTAAGGTITYTLTIANMSGGNSSGYIITDPFPSSLQNIATTNPACTVTGQTVVCSKGRLETGQSDTVIITATIPANVAGCITNTAHVLANEADTGAANNSSSFEICRSINSVASPAHETPIVPGTPNTGFGDQSFMTAVYITGALVIMLSIGLASLTRLHKLRNR